MQIKDIEIRYVSDMWATVAARNIYNNGDVIEVCPIVCLSKTDSDIIEKTRLLNVCIRDNGRLVVPGGYGGVYLPSDDPNADFKIDYGKRALVVSANRRIKPGEFIHLNRGVLDISEISYDYDEPSPLKSEGLIVKPTISNDVLARIQAEDIGFHVIATDAETGLRQYLPLGQFEHQALIRK